jgi:NitT/TauT family transport system substrate-binding protein
MLNRRATTTRSGRAPRTWLASLAVSTLVLTACGGEDEGNEGESASGDASSEETLPLVVRATGPSFTDLPMLVIVTEDLWSEVGLDVDFEYVAANNAATTTQGLIAGEMDIAAGGSPALYNAYAEGMTDLVSLGTVNPAMTFGLAVNNETLEQMEADGVTVDSPVEERVQALEGMSLASSPEGSTGQKYLKIMLDSYGVDPATDVTLVPNADAAAQLAAAREGRVNGFANSFPNTNLPDVDGWGTLWLNFAEDLPQDILPLAAHEYFTTRDWLEENPEAAERFMRATWLALEALQNPSDELKEAVRGYEAFQDLNPEAFDAGWELSVPVYEGHTPLTTEEMFENALELVNFEARTPIDIKFEDIYDLTAAEAAQP